MKKFLIILVVLIGFGFSSNATTFNKQQKLCYGFSNDKEKFIFEEDGTFKFFKGKSLYATGFYDYNKSEKTIELVGIRENGRMYELTFTKVDYSSSSKKLDSAKVDKNTYKSCN
jgi:hypothetical protein